MCSEPGGPGTLFTQNGSRMMTNQALGWKELQQMLLPLLIYVVSDLVRIPEGQRKLFVYGRQQLVFPGLRGMCLHIFQSAERF